MSDINEIAAKSLGSANSYAVYTDRPDATLLNFMPRSGAREQWGISGEEFTGYDVWHCYEATFLTNTGLPVAGTLKAVFPVSNTHVVESKSFKLYLNTFDMAKMGEDALTASKNYEKQIEADMKAGGLEVKVKFFTGAQLAHNLGTCEPHVFLHARELKVGSQAVFTDFTGEGHYIKPADSKEASAHRLAFTNVLRSRCRHTKQKDTGTAIFSLVGRQGDDESIMRQVVSLREVNEFHEFCAEKLFVELSKGYHQVGVFLLYSRRGSLDIHPIRYAKVLHPHHATRRLADEYSRYDVLHRSIFGV